MQDVQGAAPRRALLAGATGLVGRELLRLLAADSRYAEVHVLARRPLTDQPVVRKMSVEIGPLAGASSVPAADDVYLALGTTIRAAGSQEAFRRVDLDLVVHLARLARIAGATRLAVVSALGADPASRVFYNRVKGEMEAAVQTLGYRSVVIARPSLLSGDRATLEQKPRPGERAALALLAPLGQWLPSVWRPVPARAVARAMIESLRKPAPGSTLLDSRALGQFDL
ncbi:NAD(P)H-binding protein [Rivibacter subsaxonicus]|uniref:NAD(P)H-binding protein n=1 Tax=Rivibacter subsaxonicus TaxID=457575 RepID=UPI001F5F6411|nr:NAD(P)H-binding protein [Rivibacter subsaxonicus]